MVDNEGAGAGGGLQRPLLPDAGSDGQPPPPPQQPPHQQASRGTAPPWELVASSSSSELDEAEEAFADGQAAAGGEGEGGGPFLSSSAALPLHNQPVLLPWAQGATTPTGRLLREESSRLSVSGSGGATARRGWGRRLAKLLFWPPPILRWLPRYTRQQALGDALGALCVAVMVVPQGMSYAVLAGLPPVYGLFAAMSGPLVYTALGTSRHLSIGPVALVSLSLPSVCEVLYPSIADLPDDEAAALRVQAATAVALVSGVLLAALGLLRLGAVAHVIPPAVMVGFTSAAALAIGVSQLKELLGLKVPRYPYTWQTCSYVLSHLGDGQWASVAVGFGGILFLLGIKHAKTAWVDRSQSARLKRAYRFLNPLSNLLLIVATALIASLLVHNGVEIAIVKDVPNGLPSPSVPVIGGRFWTIAGRSLSVVLVAFMEAFAIGRKYALSEGYPLHVNRELLALGAANAVASCFSSYPVSGSFSRTAVSYVSGTATQLANALAACLVMAVVKVCSQYFYYIPRATLGAIIEVALLNLIDAPSIRRECRRSRLDMAVLLLTFALTLAFDTEIGLLSGLGASVLCLYWMPRGGALVARLLLRPTLKRRAPCDVLVLDLARFVATSPRVRRRLVDYLRHERAAGGAGPHMLVLLDGGRLERTTEESTTAKAAPVTTAAAVVVAAVREVEAAAADVGIPTAMVVVVGLPSPTAERQPKDGNGGVGREEKEKGPASSLSCSPLLSSEQEAVARGVLERAHSLGLVSEYGGEVALRLHEDARAQS